MIDVAWYAFEFAIAFFEIMVYVDFYNHFFLRRLTKKSYYALVVLFSLFNSLISIFFNNPLVLLINCIVLNVAMAVILFQGNLLNKLFSGVLLVALALLSEVLTGLLISALGVVAIVEIINTSIYRIAGISVSKVIFFLIVKAIEIFKKSKLGRIAKRNLLMLMLIPLISIFIIYQVAFSINGLNVTLPLITIAGIMYINILVFMLFEMLMRQSEREIEYQLMQQQYESQANYYQSLGRSRNEIRKIWHDLKNHLSCLSQMAQGGNLIAVQEYISGMHVLTEQAAKVIDTGNPSIDAVLNEKRAIAEKESIRMECDLCVSPQLMIDPIDACILLGNSLDNAIEACVKIPTHMRWIKVRMAYKDEHLILEIVNSSNGIYLLRDDAFVSTKERKEGHGFGLLNIETIAKKYGGNLVLSSDNDTFTLHALLRI